jgi:hypothetical protein
LAFWRKKKKSEPLFGVHLAFRLNTVELSRLARDSKLPSTDNLSSVWLPEHSVVFHFSITAINSLDGKYLFIFEPNSALCGGLDYNIPLPSHIVRDSDNEIAVRFDGSHIIVKYEKCLLMAFPIEYLSKILDGEKIVDCGNEYNEIAGITEDALMELTGEFAGVKLPVVCKTAGVWFKLKNSVIEVFASPIGKLDFPVQLIRPKL